ncbi:MAG: hypothetical protein GF411_15890 [Candidatus Lokiarchaeota archaeon]|nr:hypothetical protein [Candidatus Lokiarchaeota archaeon]
MSLKPKKSKPRKKGQFTKKGSQRSEETRRSENRRQQVIHWARNPDAKTPELHDVPPIPLPRIHPNTDWTSCRICLRLMYEEGIIDRDVLADHNDYIRRVNAARYRPI